MCWDEIRNIVLITTVQSSPPPFANHFTDDFFSRKRKWSNIGPAYVHIDRPGSVSKRENCQQEKRSVQKFYASNLVLISKPKRRGDQEGIFHNDRMALSHYIYNLQVVHNYGHGGSGVTLHWGCAGQVVKEIRAVTTSAVSRLWNYMYIGSYGYSFKTLMFN